MGLISESRLLGTVRQRVALFNEGARSQYALLPAEVPGRQAEHGAHTSAEMRGADADHSRRIRHAPA
jgi:hypothetical protein